MSEALDLINKKYIPGTVSFYEKFPTNPWQEAHDELERTIKLGDELISDAATKRFFEKCLSLIEQFKKTGIKAQGITPSDAFHLGDPNRVSELESAIHRTCICCGSKENLKLTEGSEGRIVVICRSCEDPNAARRVNGVDRNRA